MAKKAAQSRVKAGQSKLSVDARRKVFVEAYLSNGCNATDAALAAGFSPKSAPSQGSRLLKNVKVLAEIDSRRTALVEKHELTTDAIIHSIAQEIHFDPAKLYADDGSLKSIHELDKDTRMALSAIEFEQHGSTDAPVFVRKVKWASRAAAREQAMKHLGMFERDNMQKAGALSELPREMVKQIVERLKALNGNRR